MALKIQWLWNIAATYCCRTEDKIYSNYSKNSWYGPGVPGRVFARRPTAQSRPTILKNFLPDVPLALRPKLIISFGRPEFSGCPGQPKFSGTPGTNTHSILAHNLCHIRLHVRVQLACIERGMKRAISYGSYAILSNILIGQLKRSFSRIEQQYRLYSIVSIVYWLLSYII